MLSLTVPRMWQRGMFLDGVTYAAIARNMAAGVGNFWAPSFSQTVYPRFAEQLPLALGLEAVAFALFGDHPAVERGYAITVFLLNGLLVAAIARRLLPPAFDWVPLLLWVLPSIVTWSVVNNMLENTQAVFTSLACYAVLRTALPVSRGTSAAWAAIGAASTVAATLAKGPVGLFPMALPLLLPLAPRPARPAFPAIVWTVFAGVLVTAAIALLAFDPSRQALQAFVESHLAPTLDGSRGEGSRAADVLRHVGSGIGLRLAIVVVAVRFALRRRRFPHGRAAVFLLAMAGAASVPIGLSPLVAGHYFFPSTIFFALGAAALVIPAPTGEAVTETRQGALPAWLSAGLAAATVITLSLHGPVEPRDREMLRSLDAIRPFAHAGDTVGACPASATHWGLQSYLQRFHRISVAPEGTADRPWFVHVQGACVAPPGCTPVVDAPSFRWLRCATSSGMPSRTAAAWRR